MTRSVTAVKKESLVWDKPVVVIWIDGNLGNQRYPNRLLAADALGVTPAYVCQVIESGVVLVSKGRRCCLDNLLEPKVRATRATVKTKPAKRARFVRLANN